MNLAFNLSESPGGLGGSAPGGLDASVPGGVDGPVSGDLDGPASEGGVTSVVVTATEGSSAGVLSQATSGSVQQVSQLLSLSGTTLELAATLLTVSVVEIESDGGTSATGGSTGPGQGQGSSQANGSSSDSGDEPSDEAKQDDGASQAIVERATAWERLAIGLERSWERARAVILEVDGRSPAAEDRNATVPPATGRTVAPPVPTPARPTTKDRTGARPGPPRRPRPRSSLPSCRWGHRPSRGQRTPAEPSMPRWETSARVVTPMDRRHARAWDCGTSWPRPNLLNGHDDWLRWSRRLRSASAGRALRERWIRRRSVSIRLRRVASK